MLGWIQQGLGWRDAAPRMAPLVAHSDSAREDDVFVRRGTTALIEAIKAHRNQDVEAMVTHAADNTPAGLGPDTAGNSPLLWAVRVGNFRAFDLLANELDGAHCNHYGTSPLLAACFGTTPLPGWASLRFGHGFVIQGRTWRRHAYRQAVATLAEGAGDATQYGNNTALAQALQFAVRRNDEALVALVLSAHRDNPQVCSRLREGEETLVVWAILNRKFAAARGMIDAGVSLDPASVSATTPLAAAVAQCALYPRDALALVERLFALNVERTPTALQAAAKLPDPARSLWHRMRKMANLPDAAGYTGETQDGLRHGIETHAFRVDIADGRGPQNVTYERVWRRDIAEEGHWVGQGHRASVNFEPRRPGNPNVAPLNIRITLDGKEGAMTLRLASSGVWVADGVSSMRRADGLREDATYVEGRLQKQTLHTSDTVSEDRWQAPGEAYTWHYEARNGDVVESGTYHQAHDLGEAFYVDGRRVYVQPGAPVLYKRGPFVRIDKRAHTTTLGRYNNGLEGRSRIYRGILTPAQQRQPPAERLVEFSDSP